MPIVTKSVDAIYLGDFGNMSAGFPTGQNARADVTGTYGVQGSGAPDIGTVQALTVTGNEDFAPSTFDNDFSVDRNSTTQGIAEGSGPQQQVTYVDQGVLVTFQTATGSFVANMTVFQLADGSVYMMENPAEAPGSSFRFSNAVAGREVTEFSVPSLGTTSNGFAVIEEPWAADAFPASPDGVVDGEETGETMGVGYNDNNAPSDGGGDEITTGDDTIMGNGGDDTIDGGAGSDMIYGGAGDDSIDGGTGNDTIDGGTDSDTFLLNDSYGDDTITGGEDPDGLDIDTIDASGITTGGVTVTVTDESGSVVQGSDSADFSEIENFILTDQNDSFIAFGTSDVTVAGGAGDDTFREGNGNNTLFGGDGNDTFEVGFGASTISGGAGTDTLSAAVSDDRISVTFDGTGSGTYDDLTDSDAGTFTSIEAVQGSSGNDIINASADGGGVELAGGAGSDTIYGGSGDDTIDGGDDADTLVGGGGADSILGGAGDDLIVGGNNAGTFATSGDMPATGADTLDGGDGNDTIYGNTGEDILLGGAGNDLLLGEWGDDTLDGGSGSDTLTGGTGADVFVADGTADTITDFDTTTGIDGGVSSDNDFVDLTGFYNQTNLDAWNAANPGQTYTTPLGWLRADQADGTLGEAGNLVIARDGAAVAPSELNAENTGVVCYASGTLIRTLRGDVAIENLRVGDRVITRDNGPQKILWAGRKVLTSGILDRTPKLKPIRLSARFFDLDRDLIVSPQHGILLRDPQHGGTEKLYRATHLADLTGGAARRMLGCQHVTYHHLMLASHQTISANGMWSESLYPGKMALSAMPDDSFQEIISLFPDLRSYSVKATYGAPAIDYARRRGLPETLHDLVKAG